jgi:CubicO group peptidase (beta-lactamase class C family)
MSCTMTSEISKGKIGWDTKIASVWPEFGAGGKQDVTVKDLCEHMGGVACARSSSLPK